MTKIQKKPLFASCIGCSIAIIMTILFYGKVFDTMELKTFDFRFRHFSQHTKPDPSIKIITIDQNSIDYLKYKHDILWKWPRDIYAYVISYLTKAGAKIILLDFDFSDPDINRAEFEEGETDTLLGDAIKKAGNVINSFVLYSKTINEFSTEEANYQLLDQFSFPSAGVEHLDLHQYKSAVLPIEKIAAPSKGLGATNIYPDRDGVTRKARLLYSFNNKLFPGSALSAVLSIIGEEKISINKEQKLSLGKNLLKLNKSAEIYINWYGPGGPTSNTYHYYPIANVLLSYFKGEQGEKPLIALNEFKDSIVLIGSNAPSLYDLKSTPFSYKTPYPGVEILATIIDNLLSNNSLSKINKKPILLFIFFSCLATSLFVSTIKSVAKTILFTISFSLIVFYTAVFLFVRHNIFLSIVPIEFGIFFSFTAITIFNYLTEGNEKRWMRKAFSHYVPASIITEIVQHPEKLKLGGERKEISILFSDIRNFTKISERLDPEQVVHFLNDYFTPMTEVIFNYKGTLDKYIGDALMALFGAPLQLDFHQREACHAALDMVKALDAVKKSWQNKNVPWEIVSLDIGVGINYGEAAVGNMGSTSRFDYTAIGDAVNLTSRLEQVNKIYNTNIIVSEKIFTTTKDLFIFRELDKIRVAGKEFPVKIFELIKKKDGSPDDDLLMERIATFEQAVSLYRKRKWDDSIALFRTLSKKNIYNKTCSLFIDRCFVLKQRKLPDQWDGVFDRRTKM